ncbi:unnamed protein product [Bemisia tabaci]|uniref:Integrase catalytic domain-containing protein n=1 Tax=Bemisia tabaci TaxID=7038 RepID=A0A9P0A9F3_BEMTA|nr:unnamed protein product [Bemisia tabaci]
MDAEVINGQCRELAIRIISKLDLGAQFARQDDRAALSACLQSLNERGEELQSVISNLPETELKESLIQLYEYLLEFVVFYEETVPVETDTPQLQGSVSVTRNGMCGRPSITLDNELINYYIQNGVSKQKIADSFGISRSTLQRKIGPRNIPTLSDEDLQNMIVRMKDEDPHCGQPYISGEIRALGFYVPRSRVRKQLRIVDPVGTVRRRRVITRRRRYRVKGPNYIWNMDANEKLQPFAMYIHGAVDGYSRKVMYLKISRDKKASTVKKAFKAATQRFGWPKRVRSDKGLENTGVARCMLERRGPETRPFITGRSVHNVRIERFWKEVNKITLRFKVLFENLESIEALNLDEDEQVFYLHYTFIPVIQKFLDRFASRWNAHKIRTANYTAPNVLYRCGKKAPDLEEDLDPSDSDSDTDDNTDLNETEQIWHERAEMFFPNPENFDEYESVQNFITLSRNE